MAFTFVSTGHTLAGNSPELKFVPLRRNFPHFKAAATATIVTILVHAYIVFIAPAESLLSFVTPIICTIIAPLLLAGASVPLGQTGQDANIELGVEAHTAK